jgi:hypothetical protein
MTILYSAATEATTRPKGMPAAYYQLLQVGAYRGCKNTDTISDSKRRLQSQR